MIKGQIHDVRGYGLQVMHDDRGSVRHISKDPLNRETYLTTVFFGVVKGWHGYLTKTLHYTVIRGAVKLAMFDSRLSSLTYGTIEEHYLNDNQPYGISIPPGVFNAFIGMSHPDAMVIVCANEIFSEDRIIRHPTDWVTGYEWSTL